MVDPAHEITSWRRIVARYERPDWLLSTWQLVNTILPFGLLLYLMFRSLSLSYWLTLALSIPTAGLWVRAFNLFHDLSHRSLFRSPRVNDLIGTLLGVIVITPYHQWRRRHAKHHSTVGGLDKRDDSYLWTLTVREYLAAPFLTRIAYRVFRHPLVLFGIGPFLKMVIIERFVTERGTRERVSVYFTNAMLAAVMVLTYITVGLKALFLVFTPVVFLTGVAESWLIFVQHTFEGTYWERDSNWQYETAALQGSSFYQLPRILHWFSANIGFHHIHHLAPRIPNYRLPACHEENALFQTVKPLRVRASLRAVSWALWDEEQHRLVGWEAVRTAKREQSA